MEEENRFKTHLKTSHLTLNLGGTLGHPSEPYAVLTYNNIRVEIPLDSLRQLSSNGEAIDVSLFDFARHEICCEMWHDMVHENAIQEKCWHRDNPKFSTLNHEWAPVYLRLRDKNYIETDCKVEPDYGKNK